MKKFIISVVIFSLMFVSEITAVNAVFAVYAQREAVACAECCADKVDNRLRETIDLLSALAISDPIQAEGDFRNKSNLLVGISEQFGYMMIRVVDKELWVYSEKSEREDGRSSDLSKRDYLQNLKKTLSPQVTDIIIAGADGKTLNFTVAVPVLVNGEFYGALFAAIYESEIADMLKDEGCILYGRDMQAMSGMAAEDYAQTLAYVLNEAWMGKSTDDCLVEIKSNESGIGTLWGIKNALPLTYGYSRVEATGWYVVCETSFADAITANPLFDVLITLLLTITLFLLVSTIILKNKLFTRV